MIPTLLSPDSIARHLDAARVYIIAGFVYGMAFAFLYFVVKWSYEKGSGKPFPRNRVTLALDALIELLPNLPGLVNKLFTLAGLPPILFPTLPFDRLAQALAHPDAPQPQTNAAPVAAPSLPERPSAPADTADAASDNDPHT